MRKANEAQREKQLNNSLKRQGHVSKERVKRAEREGERGQSR